MGVFSIKDIEAVSGIRCHTLRIWELRYGIVKPKRTDSNIRYYDDEDLKCILNISILNKHGFKISEIAKMNKEDLCDQVLKIKQRDVVYDNHIKNLISAMISLDEYAVNQTLNTCIIQMGMELAMINVIFPFLNEVGILWQIGSIRPTHEHFVTGLIKQKLHVAIDGNVGRYSENRKKFILFLPNEEQHSIGLLYANYLLRVRGHEVFYLGQGIPLDDLIGKDMPFTPDYLFTILTSAHVAVCKEELISKLCKAWPDSQLLVTGIQLLNADFELPPNAKLIRNIHCFIDLIDSIAEPQQINVV